jgi:hypothetical protein
VRFAGQPGIATDAPKSDEKHERADGREGCADFGPKVQGDFPEIDSIVTDEHVEGFAIWGEYGAADVRIAGQLDAVQRPGSFAFRRCRRLGDR